MNPRPICSQTGLHALVYTHVVGGKTAGTAVELNTAGLRKQCKETYPSPAFLALA